MKKIIKSISVFGLGKLGSCIAATFAERGFQVVGVDVDENKVSRINKGLPPVDEPFLSETIDGSGGRLRATCNPDDVVNTDISFFIPPSPSLPDGGFSNEYLLTAMRTCAQVLHKVNKKDMSSFVVQPPLPVHVIRFLYL